MHANGLRLLKLINDPLYLVRLYAGSLALQPVPVDLDPVVGGLLQSVKRVAEEKGVRLARRLESGLGPVLADPDRLEKILLNLLFNALKFTPAGGSVEVGAQAEGDRILLWVADTGVGIDPEHLTRVFDRFWQADTSAQRRFQGAGIGLALVKELVQAHQGTVDLRSQPGVGTTIEVRLPAAGKSDSRATAAAGEQAGRVPAEGAAGAAGAATGAEVLTGSAAGLGGGGLGPGWLADLYRRAELFNGLTPLRENLPAWRPAGPGGRPKVLIADDEPEMRRFLRNQLSEEYEVAEAVDGEQASVLVAQLLPDVVVCDMMMPGKDGLEVCREVRANLTTQAIPFLMLTARADEETKHGVLEAGASDFLAKPFSSSELRVRIRNLVSSHQLQKALAWQNRKLEATLEQLQETELQLVQSEKLASLGRMSAGLIHEINNPLNFAHTALHLLGRMSGKLPPEDLPVFEETVRDVQEGLARVSGIISDLRGFSHREGGPLQPVDLHALVELSRRFLAAELRSGVGLVNEIPAGFTVPGEKNRLCQVLVNLFQNALDALAEQPPPGGAEIRVMAAEEARGRRVVIRDNGPGIPREVQARIFDPFFTT
ncbi:MAG: ATP-binding protein, partial [Verrucomicrobiota bacterium]